MKGYEIFEQKYLKDYFGEEGIAPYENKIGFLDFLRELKSGTQGIPSSSSFMVVGIDDVLYLAGRDESRNIALFCHKILQSSAKVLDQKIIEVQIICRGSLYKGDSFWLEYRGEKLPLDYIFGTPGKRNIRECPVYSTGFNLSS